MHQIAVMARVFVLLNLFACDRSPSKPPAPEPTPMPQRSKKPTSDRWEWYALTLNDDHEPAAIQVDLGLFEHSPQPERPILLALRAKYLGDSKGLSTPPQNETAELSAMQERIVNALGQRMNAVFVGRLSTTTFRELFFYAPKTAAGTPSPADVERALSGAAPSSHPLLIRTELDASWTHYRDFLYPTQDSLQWIADRRTIEGLQAAGDPLASPRPIQHFVYFATTLGRDAFAKAARSRGFQVENTRSNVGATATREDSAELEHVHTVVLDLRALATQYGGDYDGWESPVLRK